MKPHAYADLVASYIVHNHDHRGIEVFREVRLGRTIIAKNRRVDVFVVDRSKDRAVCLECKTQESKGTTDEKIPYALEDLRAVPLPAYLVYSGVGFSPAVEHLLQSSPRAAHCLPDPTLRPTRHTLDLDHLLAVEFRWWDVLIRGKARHTVAAPPPM